MGKIDYFTIILSKSVPIYKPGESISGVVNLRVVERLKINSIIMFLDGSADVRWTEHRSTGKSSYVVVYSENEQYINSKTIFIEKPQHDDLYLEAGDFSYPFQIILPPNLPSSLDHSLGKIHYSIKATIDIPWAFDKHTIKSFTLISPLDLNQLGPNLKQPYGLSESKILCCGCCASEPIIATFNVKKCGFVPGEIIAYNINIENRSDREVIETSVKLVQELKFTGSSRELIKKISKVRKEYRDVVNINIYQKIGPKSIENIINNTPIIIPPVSASSNDSCRIIKINYFLVFTFGCRGSLNADMAIPLTIGTIPLSIEDREENSSVLPSYEACLYENSKVTIADPIKGEIIESDLDTFKPFYPYYKDFSLQNKTN